MKAVMFRSTLRYLKFKPQDGLPVVARGQSRLRAQGRVPADGRALEPEGLGALQLAFEQLKKKLAAEGLFDGLASGRCPRCPRRIGIVTSSRRRAADIVQVLRRRFRTPPVIAPTRVQGEGPRRDIARAHPPCRARRCGDVVIVARGGGSLEDLWTFNEEAVARAIAASRSR